jgi:heme exporter protein B
MIGAFFAIVGRDLRHGARQSADTGTAVGFFILVAVLVPLGVGPDPVLLGRIAGGLIWVSALLASLLSLERLFHHDHEDGALDHLAMAPVPLALVVFAKVTAHWLLTGLPLVLAAPIAAILLNLPDGALAPLLVGLLLGTPLLGLLGCIGAALTLGARRGGVLLSLLILPLYTPVLIFGAGAVERALAGLDPYPNLVLLAAGLVLALPLAPLAAAAALRQALE